MRLLRFLLCALITSPSLALSQRVENDFAIINFKFESGESLPSLRIHYTTLGTPKKDAGGVVRNAVLMLHGTAGSGTALAIPMSPLFAHGELLDTSKYYVILPDGIGHGKSSKPSDGMHMRFPKYTYDDMVDAQHQLLVNGLGVSHLRLIMGTSMGCMHAWVWGERYQGFVDGLVPLACAPTAIVGRNRMIRELIIDNIERDPEWKNGEYTSTPINGMRAAMGNFYMMTSAPLLQLTQAPTRATADSVILEYIERRSHALDANDIIYAFQASRDYDPSAKLESVTTPVLAINSADDFVNPPELGVMEKLIPRAPHARYVLIPISDKTRGHGTHSVPAVWHTYLAEFLSTLPN
jgi:homoserine O-acetyltransferase